MGDLPHMPFFVDDYEAATGHLTLEQDGVYCRLLRLCWRMPECSIPADHDWIRARLRCNQKAFERSALPVLREFFTLAEGTYFQKRQRRVRDQVRQKIEKLSQAGKTAAEAKRLKSHGASSTIEQRLSVQSLTNQSHIQNQTANAVGRDAFDEADAALRAIPGISDHPVAASPSIAPIWQLVQQGYDLKRQIIPSIRDQLAKRPKGRLIKAWGYFVPGIVDSVQGAAPAPAAAVPVETWTKRLTVARRERQWDPKWGPRPSEPGCQVPADLLQPDDGRGWTEWKAA